MGELVRIDTQPASNVDAYRASTDAAELCKGIVVASAQMIQGRKYVKVEGWQAIAIAHNCTASARDVRRVEGGVSAVGEVRRMSDGVVIAEAEGFVGEDEPTWFGGKAGNRTLPKRADYAIRAMAQTRAISRACRSAFAHVVVMMNAGLSTTPAEEVPEGGFDQERHVEPASRQAQPRREHVETIDDAACAHLMTLAQQAGVVPTVLLKKCAVDRLSDLAVEKYPAVRNWLEAKLPKPADAILDDDIPY